MSRIEPRRFEFAATTIPPLLSTPGRLRALPFRSRAARVIWTLSSVIPADPAFDYVNY